MTFMTMREPPGSPDKLVLARSTSCRKMFFGFLELKVYHYSTYISTVTHSLSTGVFMRLADPPLFIYILVMGVHTFR